ncbi:hypothetical protein [Azospirillum doebereinerae]
MRSRYYRIGSGFERPERLRFSVIVRNLSLHRPSFLLRKNGDTGVTSA